MKIYAPVKNTNGVYASVRFVNGVGETDNPHLIEWFKSHGYKVPIEETVVDQVADNGETVDDSKPTDDVDKPDFESMTPYEIQEWARANGYASVIKNTRNKEKLIKLLRG
jgi:hypothetical protein